MSVYMDAQKQHGNKGDSIMTNEEYEQVVHLLIHANSDLDKEPPDIQSARNNIKIVGEALTHKWMTQL